MSNVTRFLGRLATHLVLVVGLLTLVACGGGGGGSSSNGATPTGPCAPCVGKNVSPLETQTDKVVSCTIGETNDTTTTCACKTESGADQTLYGYNGICE